VQKQRVSAEIASGMSARVIWERLQLQRHCSLRAFSRHVSEERAKRMNDAAAASSTPAGSISPPSPSAASPASTVPQFSKLDASISLMQATLDKMLAAVQEGTVKGGTLAMYMDTATRMQKLLLDESANERAEQLHKTKMDAALAKLKTTLDAKPAGEAMTREAVYDLVDSIMRGNA
jgi:hypothetical protein